MLSFSGCGLLTSGDQQKYKPQGEVQTELNDRDEADPSQEQTSQKDSLAEEFVCELHPLSNNEVLFKLTNNSEMDIQELTMHVEFYDEKENIITDYETYFKGVAAGQVLYTFSTHLKDYEAWDTYQTSYEAKHDSPDGLYDYSSAIEDVEAEDEIREGSDYTYYATFRNIGSKTIDYVNALILFYHEDELTGAGERIKQNIDPDDSFELEFMAVPDADGRMIQYNRYEVVLSQAYYKK
jgi:hypothetical protein